MDTESSIQPLKNTYNSHRLANGGDKLKGWLEDQRLNANLPRVNSHLAGRDVWRVRNGLYDLTPYLSQHPGGIHWLNTTKGMDVTDYFEVFHLNQEKVEHILQKYKVGEVTTPRCTPFLFKEDGFYKTLQRRVLKILGNRYRRNHIPQLILHWCITISCIATFLYALSVKSWLILGVSSFLLAMLMGTSHNYLHKNDSWSMYTFDMSCFSMHIWELRTEYHIIPIQIVFGI